jgi:hypothetical protein
MIIKNACIKIGAALLVFAILMQYSCKKNDPVPGNTITDTVYITGAIDKRPAIWKNGVPAFLAPAPTGPHQEVFALQSLVYNNDVYVLGQGEDPSPGGDLVNIKVWKNGVLITTISNGVNNIWGYRMDVYSGDVYICGGIKVGNDMKPKVWKNGVAITLSQDSFDYAEPSDIKVVNGDVYVSGYVGGVFPSQNIPRAAYWKNGVLNLLSNNYPGSGTSAIFVNNTDIYITGSESVAGQNLGNGVYWKNGIKTSLSLAAPYTSAEPTSIFIDNNDVYFAGSTILLNLGLPLRNASYWKNNNISMLTNYSTMSSLSFVHGIFVKNNIVHTLVDYFHPNASGFTPFYFQNNAIVPLTGFTNTQQVYFTSIFVK